jgi:hypothetical protein
MYLFSLSTCFEQHSAHHQEIDCINTSSSMYVLVRVTAWYAGTQTNTYQFFFFRV